MVSMLCGPSQGGMRESTSHQREINFFNRFRPPKILRMDTSPTPPQGEEAMSAPPPPRLLDAMRQRIRVLHYSLRTAQAYVDWARRFILFHGKRHPREMGAPEVTAFLTHLAVDRQVSASTQNQAKAAILFLYKEVLQFDLPWLGEVVAAKASRRLPVVLTQRGAGITAAIAGHDLAGGFIAVWHGHAHFGRAAPAGERRGIRAA